MGNKTSNHTPHFSRHMSEDMEPVKSEPQTQISDTELVLTLKELSKFPFEALANKHTLEKLNLAKNKISNISVSSEEEKEVFKNLATSLNFLTLSENPLSILPDEICDLTNIRELNLSSMQLNKLPGLIGNLKKLQVFDLFLNKLDSVDFSGLGSLTKVLLSFNYVVDLDVGELNELSHLDACSNELAEVPKGIEKCTKLKELKLRFNRIKVVSDSILLASLSKINLSHNFVSTLPESFLGLENLVELKLDHNELVDVPTLPSKIERVDLQNNKIRTIAHLADERHTRLDKLNLSNNEIEEIGDSLAKAKISYLDLGNNKIKKLPQNWPEGLIELFLGYNQIEEVSLKVPSLSVLFLCYNQIQSLPKDFFMSHSNLKTLSFAMNQIIDLGETPFTEGDEASKLENLFLGFNQIKEFPKGFFLYNAKVSLLDFSYNLVSKIPPELSEMSFNHIHMNNNLLDDSSLEILQELSTMYLYISDNQFSKELDKDEMDFEEAEPFVNTCVNTSGAAEMCGMRPTFEDSHVLEENFEPGKHMYAVFDGHGGSLGAKKAAETLLNIFKKTLDTKSTTERLVETFELLEKEVCEASFKNVEGATATVIIVESDMIYCANLGDSRSILISSTGVKQLSYEHKGYDRQEHDRIRKCGGFITENDRVQGIIAVPRSLGDKGLKKYLSSDPYISSQKISDHDEWVVIACDGVWDVLDNGAVASLIDTKLSASHNARKIRDCAFALGSTDNISSLIVNLKVLHGK